MAILYGWITAQELKVLRGKDFLEEKIIKKICDKPEIEISKVYLFVSDSYYKTTDTEELKLYSTTLKNYWDDNFNKDLKKLCQQYEVEYSNTKAFEKETNDDFKSELNLLYQSYSGDNRKGVISIKATKFCDNLLENTYSELFDTIYNEEKYDSKNYVLISDKISKKSKNYNYVLISDKISKKSKNYIAEIIQPYELQLFPRSEDEQKDAVKKLAKQTFKDADLLEFLNLDLNQIINHQKGPIDFKDILTEDSELINLKHYAEEIAKTDFPVLILGDSGTGKELFAKAIHNASKRSIKGYYAINCGAIPNDLLESELFGHKKGAFTGALEDKKGLFEEANGGTLFLDEIGEMSLFLQTKLLRAIDNGKIRRVGGNDETPIDIRFIYATNKDLYKRVNENQFREDLYYRINVLDLKIPPLKDRDKGDIELIMTKEVLDKYPEHNKYKFKKSAIELLYDYDWPGNVRQLKAVIIKSLILSMHLMKDIDKEVIEISIGKEAIKDYYERKRIDTELFTATPLKSKGSLFKKDKTANLEVDINKTLLLKGLNLKSLLESIEKEYIAEALDIDRDQKGAGKRLGYSQQKISQKVKKYNL